MSLSYQQPSQESALPEPMMGPAPTASPFASPTFGGNLLNLQSTLGNQGLLAMAGVGVEAGALLPVPEGSNAKILDIDFEAQRLGYTCGPTAAHNALSARMENAPSQETLADQLHTHENGGTNWIGQITEVMNSYLDGDPYVTTEMPQDPPSPETRDRLWGDIVTSIDNNYPVVANIWAPADNHPPGYPNEMIQHYITLTGYNPDTGEVHVSDSANFQEINPDYQHQYWLSLDKLSTLIPPKGYSSYRPPPEQGPQEQGPQEQGPQEQGPPSGQNLDAVAQSVMASVPEDMREHAGSSVPAILRQCAALNITDPNQVAYILATAQHESRFGTPMYERSQSLVEDRNPFTQNADGSWSGTNHLTGNRMTAGTFEQLETEYWDACYGGMLGNQPGTTDAARYRGRGYVQLTGRNNYERMTNSLNASGFTYTHDGVTYGGEGNPPIDLLANPEHVNLVPDLAANILVSGMSAGSFTGKSLNDSINENGVDFWSARRIVNGDVEQNGSLVAGYAESYAGVLNHDDAWTRAREPQAGAV